MDELAAYNRKRWNMMSDAGIVWGRPWLDDLSTERARQLVDPRGLLGDVAHKKVLALAASGGQQSVALALLGAAVTVFDLSDSQLAADARALAHHQLSAELVQGDMRDLSAFSNASFDTVWQAFSINFVPDPETVFREVARVIRPGGVYHVEWHNPFTGTTEEEHWNGGYPMRTPYDDAELLFDSDAWVFENEAGEVVRIPGPREFNHKLSSVLNGVVAAGFEFLGLSETEIGDIAAKPGTFAHYAAVMPPFFNTWWRRHV